jgi:hypothetical protein
MRDDQHHFLMLMGQLPARLTAEQVAWVINCQPHDIPILVACRLFKPLGNPAANCIKYFARDTVLELAKDPVWLGKVTQAIYRHRQHQNAKGSRSDNESHKRQPHNGELVSVALPLA